MFGVSLLPVVCTFSFGHCVVCSSSIYELWLPIWYLQTLLMLYLHYLCLFTYSGVQHIFCVFSFGLFSSCVLYTVYPMLPVSLDCPSLIVPLVYSTFMGNSCRKGFCFGFLRLVYHMLPVSLDYPLLIAPSIFSNLNLSHNFVSSTPHHDPHGIKYIY